MGVPKVILSQLRTVIGSGVLSLSWSVAQLGWIAVSLVLFAHVTYLNASLLINFHHYSDPHNDVTVINRSYLQAGDQMHDEFILGVLQSIQVGSYLYNHICKAIGQSNCYHGQGHESACSYSVESYMLLFGFIHIIASQIPNFHSTKWLSIIAAIMSFTYSLIGSGLGLAQTIGNGKIEGIGGVPTDKPIQKTWLVAQAIGDIAFAYPFLLISFGNSTPVNILTGFGFYEPYWLIDFANACVFLHLVGGYQSWWKSTISHKLVDMVIDDSATANGISEGLKDIFHDNKVACVIQLDKEIRNMSVRAKFPERAQIICHREKLSTFDVVRSMVLLEESEMLHQSNGTSSFHNTSSSPPILVATNTGNDKTSPMNTPGI
ncbi:amino acid transporter, transmembrane domain-containing protein [Artemisia annua]|uniref:Amino acid transporter, transmembrane domain-containing protein n=1 Tax=Artemisia annua TaxID=35608 RepID=A0A2U1PQH4_ARTAN|nr:amino acid transporter, transmembrane domain-containing protein [Artemisia annua]